MPLATGCRGYSRARTSRQKCRSAKGDRNAGNDGGVNVTQKKKDDHHHQADGQHHLELNIVDRCLNGGRQIGERCDFDAGGQIRLKLRQQLLDALDDADRVRARLALYVENRPPASGSSTLPACCFRRRLRSDATSFTKTGAPLRYAITTLRYSSLVSADHSRRSGNPAADRRNYLWRRSRWFGPERFARPPC